MILFVFGYVVSVHAYPYYYIFTIDYYYITLNVTDDICKYPNFMVVITLVSIRSAETTCVDHKCTDVPAICLFSFPLFAFPFFLFSENTLK